MGSIRLHPPGAIHFITNRCEHEQFLMLPNEEINQIIHDWLVKSHALHGTGIEIFAFNFLSNHFHILLRNNGDNLAQFMCYFQSNVAREINAHWERRGKFFAREYDDILVDGDDAFVNRYCYVLSNAVKAGLVDTAEEWKGLNSYRRTLTGENYRASVLNRSKYYNATRRGQDVLEEDFIEEFEMRLSVPPMWEDKSQAEIKSITLEYLEAAEHTYRARRENGKPLGMPRVLAQKHTDSPLDPARSPRFKILCFNKERKKELLAAYRQFVGTYRSVLCGFRKAAANGKRPLVEWPPWSYPPSCYVSVTAAA